MGLEPTGRKRAALLIITRNDPTAGFVLPVSANLYSAGVGILAWEGETFLSGVTIRVPPRL